MIVDGVEVTNINVPDLSQDEIRRYMNAIDKPLRSLEILRLKNGKIQLDYETKEPFERIRRITGEPIRIARKVA